MDAVNRMAHRLYDSDRKLDARPTFRAWLKYTAVDLVTMLCLGGVGLGVRINYLFFFALHHHTHLQSWTAGSLVVLSGESG